ncbi:Odorant receptor 083 [Nylanderia fulva]|uniref:Odorant receptor n=2 Tax=Nylanderia fulva TaxID=613905 RepID=A0A6G1LRD0_9HYME|nr:Odorant receptor 083 [Nylanderia fulva]
MTRKSTVSQMIMFSLPLCGIWPGKSIVLIIRMFWIFAAVFIEFCHYYYFFTHLSSQYFFNLVDCFCTSLAHGKVIIKLILFWINQQKLMEIMALIADDWKDCANSDIGVHVTMEKAKISDRISKIIILLNSLSVISYCSEIILADADVTKTAELPYINNMKFPFNINTQNMYRFVLIAEFLHMFMSNWTSGLVNAMILILVFHVGGQIEILQSWLSKLTISEIGNKEESIVTAINKIIRKHQKIIKFSENIEDLYTYISLILFAANTLSICMLGFIIITAIDSPDAVNLIIKCLLFFTTTNLEAFIYCYAGEYLSNKSKAIGLATYNSPWYTLRPKDSRVLLFIILRSQKQLTLTAGTIIELSFVSFTSIMNASGSYLSMLLGMQ